MMSSIEIKRKMMKLYRGELLKEVYSTLLKLVTKIRIVVEEKKEEEEGIRSSSKIEIIRNPRESIKLAYELIQSAEQEVLRIFPSIHAFRRQTRMGIMHLFKDVVEHGVKVRILIHADENQIRQVINEVVLVFPDIDIKGIDMSLNTSIGIVIVETRDDARDNSYDASGLAAYSNSKYIALSYASIFESLWIQAELYKQLKEANEQLKQHDKMQNEFINLAAHELRTPIQPILGFTEIVSSKIKNNTEQRELLDAVTRNAKRLQRLVDDIIDVTKIESQSLKLNKEELNLNHVITNIIDDYNNLIASGNHKIKLYFNPFKETLLIKADKERISEVMSNLLSNAIKFTKEDAIFISIEKREDDNINYALVTVKDTGGGIDPEILPNMFSKFITKSFEGLGLGLYISKHIVKAHGGKIEGKNNNNGIGAEFGFTLPLINDTKTL